MTQFTKDRIQGIYKKAEDSSFQSVDSPVVVDFNTDIGNNVSEGYVTTDGEGDILLEVAGKDFVYGGQFTLKKDDVFNFGGLIISKIRLTHSGTDSSYRVWGV